ncbi:N-acetylglutamate synthase [Aureobasidium sp. EXF-10727]|nr:N-acetylglutamate synthase [Aureobasidium sp. EXF-10727]KAI4726885.1 N-acetylglutamate synthase [Aureobasidium sp. EXF-10728]
MAACLPTLRSRVRPDAVKSLHRDFNSLAANRSNHANSTANGEKRDKLAQRDFFFDLLNASSTRRDAKQYLARFKPTLDNKPKKPLVIRDAKETKQQWQLQRSGVNLGQLYLPTQAAAATPTFSQYVEQETQVQRGAGEIHVALVCLRAPHLIDDETLDGIALTMAQLVRLDMQIVLVLNCEDEIVQKNESYRETYRRQGSRVVAALERHNNEGARYVESALNVTSQEPMPASRPKVMGAVELGVPKLITDPLKRSAIPVIPAMAYDTTCKVQNVSVSGVMLALTRALSGLATATSTQEEQLEDTSVDRIIMLDPLGGLPTETRQDQAHVFVNLEQEHDMIRDEIQSCGMSPHHLDTLSLVRDCLALLPPASSALLISPEEAAISSHHSRKDQAIGITTRRQKNPLIHNLLTNKPLISSSLPAARLSANGIIPSLTSENPTRSTLVKRGMPLMIVPDLRNTPWTPPKPGEPTIALDNHPDINFPRLVALIEDSFRRPLDAKHYLNRIKNRVAGVIIAGEYEGGAILTWEEPRTLDFVQSGADADPTRLVPYLDKFAVLQRSQGSSGVADIVFQAMVRSCFPDGVCWRSRSNNPVNKWYFERSRGTWHLQDTQWTMFWTNPDLVADQQRWEEYVSVCRNIEPSWADNKAKPD